MPKIARKPDKYDKLRQLIFGRMVIDGVTREEFGRIVGLKSQASIKKRLDEPESLTLGELAKISRGLSIPIDELRAAIPV